jgi:hypothetical protein
MFMDEKTIDSDPLISNALGGVKLLVDKNDFKKTRNRCNHCQTIF